MFKRSNNLNKTEIRASQFPLPSAVGLHSERAKNNDVGHRIVVCLGFLMYFEFH